MYRVYSMFTHSYSDRKHKYVTAMFSIGLKAMRQREREGESSIGNVIFTSKNKELRQK